MNRRNWFLSLFGVAPVEAARAPSGGPTFVDNAMLGGAQYGMPNITRDIVTGRLFLPSVPNPASSLHLYVEGLRQSWGRHFTMSGSTVIPAASSVELYKAAVDAVADWRR